MAVPNAVAVSAQCAFAGDMEGLQDEGHHSELITSKSGAKLQLIQWIHQLQTTSDKTEQCS